MKIKRLLDVIPFLALAVCLHAQVGAGGTGLLGGTAGWQAATTPTLQILPPFSFSTTVAASFSQTLASAYGVGTLTWSESGTLPSGLSLNTSTGVISGTVGNNAGNYPFTVTVTDSSSPTPQTATQSFNISVLCTQLVLTGPTNWPPATQGIAYNYTVPVSGGIAPLSFTATNLPASETINSGTGVVSGTPGTAGTYSNIGVTVTDSCPTGTQTAAGTFTEQVNTPPAQLTITTQPTLPAATTGVAYSTQLSASGGTPPYTAWTVTIGSLPAGLSLSNAGVISGTPTGAGTSNFTVQVTDSASGTATLAMSLTVSCPALSISTQTLPSGTQNQAYSFQEGSTGGFGAITWSGSAFPVGIAVSSSGLVSGATATSGTFTVGIVAKDSCPTPQSTSISPTLVIAAQPPPNPPVISTTSPLPQATQGQAYNLQMQATQGTVPYSWAVTGGAFPNGMNLSTGGVISGSPTVPGSFSITIQVTDSNGLQSTPVTFALTVVANSGPLTIVTTSPLPGCTINQTCSIQFVATGGTPPYSWTAPGGSGGPSWALAFTNPSNCPYVHGFAVRSTNNEWYIACHTQAVVLKSTNQGGTWTNISPSISSGDFWSVQVNPNDGSLVVQTQGAASAGGKTYVSTNDGASWTLTQPSNWTGVIAGSHSGCAFSTSPDVEVCGSYNGTSNQMPWWSTNNGPNAAAATSYTGGNNGSVYGLGINPLDNCFFLGGEASGSFRSCNGHDWTLVFACISSCSGSNGNVTSFAFDTSGNALEAAQGGVYKSSGSGNSLTWTNVFHPGGQMNDVVADTSGNLYVNAQTASHAEYRSTDQGVTWNTFDTGIASGLQGAFALQNPADGKLYSVFFNDPAGSGSVYSTAIGAQILPAGLSLNSSGLLSGTPTTAGTYSFTVQVTDHVSSTASGTFSLTIGTTPPPQPTITTTSPFPDEVVGTAVSLTMAATGGTPPYTWTNPTGAFPTGESMNSAGAITGTPTTAGTYTPQITVTDKAGFTDGPDTFSITVACPAESITTTSLPPAVKSTAYNATVQGNGGVGTITWGFSGLPSGITGNTSTGVISGSTSSTGTFSVTITRTDSCLPSGTVVSVTLPLQVNNSPVSITTTSLPNGTLNQAYSATLSASGGTTPYTWSITAGTLQSGLSFSSAGVISGTPTAASTVSLTFQVTDNASNTATATMSLTVAGASSADNRYCSTSETWTGPASKPVPGGNASAPQVCVRTAVSDTPSPGSTVTVTAGSCSSLQSAISGAVAGETIVVPALNGSAQDVFSACTIKPAAAGNKSNWITVRTDQTANLPAEGSRISPAWVGITSLPGRPGYAQPTAAGIYLPKIIGAAPSAIQFAGTAAYWRFVGIEITSPAGTNYTQLVQMAGNHIIFDRVVMHGGNSPNWQDHGSTQAAFTFLSSTYGAVVDSYIGDIHCVSGGSCQQAAGIALGGNSTAATGISKVVNNFIESSGENLFSGGGGCSGCTILPATDIEIRRNHTYKPAFWATGDSTYFGTLFELDNCSEMKNVQRAWFEGNIFENSWGQGSQQGNCFILGPKNQSSAFTGSANSDGAGNITWVSGGQFRVAEVSSLCATPGHCNFKLNGVTYQVASFVSATKITITPAAPAGTSLAFTGWLPGLNAFAVNNDVIVVNNYITGAARVGGIYLVNSDGGDAPKGLNRVFLQNNGADHIDGWYYNNSQNGACCVWATGEQLQSSSVFINGLVLDHNTFVTYLTGGSKGIGPAFGFGSTKQTINNVQVTNNIGTSGFGSSGFSGSVETLVTGWTPKAQLCWDHNFFAEATTPFGVTGALDNRPYPVAADSGGCGFTTTGNTGLASYSTFLFTANNNGIGINMQLQNTSPAHNAASDGSDAGVNWNQLQTAIAGVN